MFLTAEVALQLINQSQLSNQTWSAVTDLPVNTGADDRTEILKAIKVLKNEKASEADNIRQLKRWMRT